MLLMYQLGSAIPDMSSMPPYLDFQL
ncbi:hypothetical protein EALG_00899 [Escherichia coli TA144]|nr:hypothetical protein EALG_00899 [Escherichia coli TA144]